MPTWQGEEFLERVLKALAAQDLSLPWDMLVVDSGSTDGTLDLLESAREDFPVPLEVRSIHQVEFDHGDTRNLLASLSTGDLCVFLTQDAIPSGPSFLTDLVANFDDPAVGAATCRNLPRPDAHLLTRVFSDGDPGYSSERRETIPQNSCCVWLWVVHRWSRRPLRRGKTGCYGYSHVRWTDRKAGSAYLRL